MKTRMISLCLVMVMLITMLPKISLPVSASIPDVWYDFLSTRGFFYYMLDSDGTDEADYQYAVYDLNNDGVTELVIQFTRDAPFFFTEVFALNNGNIISVHEDYGYGSYRYSPKLNMVIGSSETRPDAYSAYSPFYSLSGTWLEYKFTVGQDLGESFYSDDSGRKNISEEERSSYYEDVVWLEFADVTDIPKTEIDAGYPYSIEEIEEMVAAYYNKNFADPSNPGTYVVFGGETWVSNGICLVVVRFQGETATMSNVYIADVSVDMVSGAMSVNGTHKGFLWEQKTDSSAQPYLELLSGQKYLSYVKEHAPNFDHDEADGNMEYRFALVDIDRDGTQELIVDAMDKLGWFTDLIFTEGSGGSVRFHGSLFTYSSVKYSAEHAVLSYILERPAFGVVPYAYAGISETGIIDADLDEMDDTFEPLDWMTLDDMLLYLQSITVEDETEGSVSEDDARAEWIRQHMDYADSQAYEDEIIGGYSEWMLAAFRDACNDKGVESYETRKFLIKLLDLDLDFSEAEMYELILAELLYGNTSLNQNTQAYTQNLQLSTSDLLQSLVNIVDSTNGIGDDVKTSINSMHRMLQTLEFGSDAYSDAYSEFVTLFGEHVSDVKGSLKNDALFAGGGIMIDYAFEKYDALEDILTYINNYNAFQAVSRQTRGVLQHLAYFTYVQYDGVYGVNTLIDELGLESAWVNWTSFQEALQSIIVAMGEYESEGADAVATYAVEREKKADKKFKAKTIKTITVFAVEKGLSCIPFLKVLITAKDIASAGLEISVLLDAIFTNVDEREYAVDILVKTYCISLMLDETVENCANNMKEDDFFSTTVFDEAVSIYRKNQLLASSYMLKYADLAVADMLAEVAELEYRAKREFGYERVALEMVIRQLWERLAWYSRHLKDLEAERRAIEAIACHDDMLHYDPNTDEVLEDFLDARIYVLACPVDVIVKNKAGEQIAYLSGETNQVASEYRFYFHTIKMTDGSGEYIKVAIVPDGYQIELQGTGDGTMDAFVMDFTDQEIDTVESFFDIPVAEGSVGYFEPDTNADDAEALVMDRIVYSAIDHVDDLPTYSESRGPEIWWICIAAGTAVCGIILVCILMKKRRR